VTKLIRFCPSQRISILTELRGHVLRLLLHREASSVIADVFELYTNTYERSLLVRDFYGKEAALFSLSTVGSEEDKDQAKKGLRGVLEDASPDQRTRILNATKENIMTM
jgi:pumilio family protein 6